MAFGKRDLGVSFGIDLQFVFEYQNVRLLFCVKEFYQNSKFFISPFLRLSHLHTECVKKSRLANRL